MKKKYDVLLLCQFFYPEYISSAMLPYETALAFANDGLKVGVLCGYPKEYTSFSNVNEKENIEGIEIKRLKYIQTGRKNMFGRLINYFSFTFIVLLNLLELRKSKSIIVYSNPPILPLIALIASKIYKIKLLFVSYDQYPEIAIRTNTIKMNSIISRIMRVINHFLYPNLDQVIALSEDMKDFIIANRKIKEDKIVVIPNWANNVSNLDSVKPNDSDLASIFSKHEFFVSYLGNMGIAQDFSTILDTIALFKESNEVGFFFAGHGSKLDELKRFIEVNNYKNVYFKGFLHDNDYYYALARSNVFLVTLNDNLLGLASPSKIYHYMMAGKPIISIMNPASDVAKEICSENFGFNISISDKVDLLNKINLLKDNNKTYRLMCENSKNSFISKYNKEILTNRYLSTLKEVLYNEI